VPVEVDYGSEYRYRNPIVAKNELTIVITQSGETADTLASLREAKRDGVRSIAICNVVGSMATRETDGTVYTHAGPEIGVASTKAFTAQVTVLTLLAMIMGQKRGTITDTKLRELMVELDTIPAKVEKALELDTEIQAIAEIFKDSTNFLYLGRGYNFPVALEGALKLKEISYIHAEGYPAAEMKHGPIALIDENMPVVVIATRDSSYEKVVSNIQEVKARKGRIIAVVSEGDTVIPAMAEFVIEVPHTSEVLMPLVSVVPLQLLSYHIAVLRGCNVDQPRNLAKSVTVE
jgi:glucosamine--fructose-6-phosphate aminotransferase (isomerizing)